ncbi:MAG: DeoR/GlpR transcriptional regulator [Trueperaceae bacterium]|nr:DeoR/GlpR transcriptional regulator [Trueperaceae bacterium]
MIEANDSVQPQDLLPEERRKVIQKFLLENGSVRTTVLAAQINVSPITVRRDLRELAESEEIRLVHGGAVLAAPVLPVTNQDLSVKRDTNIEAKTEIAKKAASLIKDGDIIALNSGSTMELIINYFPTDFNSLTVIALGLNVACAAAQLPYVNLIVPGGTLRRSSQAFVGINAVHFLAGLRIDKGFFGAQAVDVEAGFTESSLEEVATNKQLLEICTHRYLAADSSKYGRVAVGKICDLDEFDGLIIDSNAPKTLHSWAAATGTQLI